jgi:signal transduction histidine kinase
MLRSGAASTRTFRLTLTVAVLFTASVVGLFVFIFQQTTAFDMQRLSRLMATEAQHLAAVEPTSLPQLLEERRLNGPDRQTSISLFGPDGAHIWGSFPTLTPGLPVDGTVHRIAGPADEGQDRMFLALALSLASGETLLMSRNISTWSGLREAVIHVLVVGVVPLVLAGLVIGIWLSTRTARRLQTIHEAIVRIMQGNLHERLPVSAQPDDLNNLAVAMNSLLDEIQHRAIEMQSIGDDIARDLCTPLTRIRARLDRGRSSVRTADEIRDLIDASIADLDTTFGIMTTLLRLGEIQSGRVRAGFAVVDLAEIALEVCEIYAPMAETAHLTLDVRAPATAPMHGDRDLLVEALANLVSNAIKFTPPPGRVAVAVDCIPGGVSVSVTDTGPGIPPAVAELVMRRFDRGEGSQPMLGGGLGLCLVVAIAKLHDLCLVIENTPGCMFKLFSNKIQPA